MLNIILDACRQNAENVKQNQMANYPLYVKTEDNILFGTWAALKQSLEPIEFHSLDAYVDGGFARLRHPGQTAAKKSKPEPVNNRYQVFIYWVAAEDVMIRQEARAGYNVSRRDYSQEANFPEEEEQPVLAILLDANQRLRENEQQTHVAVQERDSKYTIMQIEIMTPDPEVQALIKQHSEIIDDTISKLQMELGEESFNNLDEWVTRTWFGN
jgi:hypothetical protein